MTVEFMRKMNAILDSEGPAVKKLDRIEVLCDTEIGNAIRKADNFGELLDAVGLDIKRKGR